ncbi:hypothetical protein [Leptospira dzoumogneensis]|uniref:Uncharacterized protein n=1 Tax=Leptospira dzoumogneensis TaxID=2484904 RepID=A0A4Z1ADJ0_9LEPT|nr:hypothetical protein [Leptospira dzoumogneensis]TGM98984.1 hypothetical protein EHR06_10975 [Leptospira dzoumogneensis]
MIEITIKTFQDYSLQNRRENIYSLMYDYSQGTSHFRKNERTLFQSNLVSLENLAKDKFEPVGISKSNLLTRIKEINELIGESAFEYELESDYSTEIFYTSLYIIFIIQRNGIPNANNAIIFSKFLSDNIIAYYQEERNVAIPISYFLPIPTNNSNVEKLYKKGFLNLITVTCVDWDDGLFRNYYKPPITPLGKIYLNESEETFYYWMLKRIDLLLRKKGK